MLQLYNSMEMLEMGVTLWSVTLLHRRPVPITGQMLDSGMLLWTTRGYQLSLDRPLVLPLLLLLLLNQSTFCVYCSTLKPHISPSPRLHPSSYRHPHTAMHAPARPIGPLYLPGAVPFLSFLFPLSFDFLQLPIISPRRSLLHCAISLQISAVLFSHTMREYHGFSYP